MTYTQGGMKPIAVAEWPPSDVREAGRRSYWIQSPRTGELKQYVTDVVHLRSCVDRNRRQISLVAIQSLHPVLAKGEIRRLSVLLPLYYQHIRKSVSLFKTVGAS